VIKSINAVDLKAGDVLALPMGRTATVSKVMKVGTQFVTFSTTEYGTSRVGRHDEVLLEVSE
jgi:hypothetical protein